jgi:NADH/NAD ratio-sensing transcriptional regulator Rex
MTLSTEQQKQILADATALVANRMWQEIESKIDQIACVSINRAAAAVDLTPQQVRRLLTEYVDFGDKATRVSIAQLNALIASRTVKAARR